MRPLTSTGYIFKRLADDWKLLLSAFVGILVASSLVAGAPVYLQALDRQSINTDIDRASDVFLNVFVVGPYLPLERTTLTRAETVVNESIQRHISDVERMRRQYVKAPTYLVGLPERPLPTLPGVKVSRGYFQYLSNLEPNVDFIQGKMSGDAVTTGPEGLVIEGVLGTTIAADIGLSVGDVLTLTPSLRGSNRLSVRLTGIIEATEPASEYWQRNARIFIDPGPLDENADPGVTVDPQEPPLALFVTEEALIEGVGRAFPGTLVSSSWYVMLDKDGLKGWSIGETRRRIDGLESDLTNDIQGATIFTGISSMLDEFEQRSFFSSVPLLLLLIIMVITVLYYLAMMVAYIVQSREDDVAVLRGRGITTLQLVRMYATEGLALTLIAVIIAPFLAMAAVALAGLLPYFSEITGGEILPVELHWTPFLVAAGSGVLCLAIFVIPGIMGARTSLIVHKLRSSRPPSVPLFQRYFLDIGLLGLGGLVFWELQAKGELVSGGLFKGFEVNEALLLAPVLFLTVVALLFLRFFPLFVRFISGESLALVHLLTAATVVTLGPAIVAREVDDGDGIAAVAPLVFLALFSGVYWATQRAGYRWSRGAGFTLQSVFVAAVVLLEPPAYEGISLIPTLSLIAIVPAQFGYLLLRASSRFAPVWISMGLWHMARNPLQYSWLVLLLVMITGLGLLATRVGGTLERSHEERIRYEVAADLRVSNIPEYQTRNRPDRLKEKFLGIPGVQKVSLASRSVGSLGTSFVGRQFEVLAVEIQHFPDVTWYREDFSERPLGTLMQTLQPRSASEPMEIPEGASTIGVWVKPTDFYPNVSLRLILQDSFGVISVVFLGGLEGTEWMLMSGELPRRLVPPFDLVSVQISEPGFGPTGTPGSILLDDIHYTGLTGSAPVTLEGFEGGNSWSMLPTSIISSDTLTITDEDVLAGDMSGLFTFGKDTDNGIRGFYRIRGGSPVPAVVSSTFLDASGANIGNQMIVNIMGHFVPILIRDSVEYFPTLDPGGNGFILTDLNTLLDHVNMVSPAVLASANEMLIDEAPGAGLAVREVAASLGGSPGSVHDKASRLEAVRLDPLITGGWRAMVVLSLGIIVVIGGLGYLTYLLAFADRSRSEMAFLQAMGLSRRQMTGLLAMEHIVVVLIGLGLGSWAGLEMSRRLVSAVAVTEDGDPVLPPLILMTDWNFMVPIYAVLVGLFLAALYVLVRGMRRLDLQAISRGEGD